MKQYKTIKADYNESERIIPEGWDFVQDTVSNLGKSFLIARKLTPEEIVQYQAVEQEWQAQATKAAHNKPILEQIDYFKKLLAKEDYKIIKCYEAQLKNEPMPYDIQELIAQRGNYRAQINNLEEQLL